MAKLKELQDKRASLLAESDGIVAKLDTEAGITADEEKRFDAIGDEIKAVDKTLSIVGEQEKRKSHVSPGLTLTKEIPTGRTAFTIPAEAKRWYGGRSKVFTGADQEETAYRFGMACLATIWKNPKAVDWCNEHGVEIGQAMSSTTNSAGGFAIAPEFIPSLIRLVEDYGVFRRNSRVVPMASDAQTWPRRTAGQTAYFVAENTAATQSNPTGDNVQLFAKELATLCLVPRTLAEDAVFSIADLVGQESALAFAVKEDTCGFLGDGTSTYGGINGIVNALAAGAKVTCASGSNAFIDITIGEFESCVGKAAEYPGANYQWYISKPGYYASMARLMDAIGGATMTEIAGSKQKMFLGYPVNWTMTGVLNAALTDVTSTVQAVFADLNMGTMFGDRRSFTLESDGGGTYFAARQIAIQATERFDINIHDIGTSTAAGSIVALVSAS